MHIGYEILNLIESPLKDNDALNASNKQLNEQ